MNHPFRRLRGNRARSTARLPLPLFSLLLAVWLAVACGGDSTPSVTSTTGGASAFPLTVTDSGGKAVAFQSAPQRIISYSPGATEVLYAVGAGPHVVAVDRFSDYPSQVASLPKLEYSKPAPEPAVALKPDLIVMATNQEAQIEQFRGLGLTVLYLKEPKDIPGVIEQVRLLGRVTGESARAETVATGMEKRVQAVRDRVSKLPTGPAHSVFFELTPDLYTVSPDSFIGALLILAKADNIAAGTSSAFPQLSQETVIKTNPEVILLSDAGSSGGQSLATVRARPGWSTLRAVQSGKVYEVDANVFSRPGPRIVDALEQLVKLLYPTL